MVERKLSGFSAKAIASLAPLLPFRASELRRDFRAERSAISDIENTPFSNIRRMMTIMSFINNGLANGPRVLEPTEAII